MIQPSHKHPTHRPRRAAAVLALCLLAAIAPAAASAQAVSTDAYVTGTSDYVFRGVSQTLEDPALQAGVDFGWKSLTLSLWTSDVDFGPGSTADQEVDVGLAWSHALGANSSITVGALRYFYSGEGSLNYNEYYVSFDIGSFTAGYYVAPDYSGTDGEATYIDLNQGFSLGGGVDLTLHAGRNEFDVLAGVDYWDYSAQVARSFGRFDVDVTYWDTDIDNLPIADQRIVGTVTVNF